MSRFTLDSATEFLFGSCVHSLAARLPYAHNSSRRDTHFQPHPSDDFAAAFSQAQHQTALRNRLTDSWPLGEFWKDRTKDSMKVIIDYIDPILKDALTKKGTAEKKSPTGVQAGDGETLLDHLVEQTAGERWSTFVRNMIKRSAFDRLRSRNFEG
jgi:hypothetical protein